ncbi:MAG: GPO family capsid scaffolding protein [Sphingomonas parapaucimobilis]
MGTKSKFFRAFVEGQTISDGRTITAEMIDQVVETFNPQTYSPRINVEHISGYSPEPPFNGYGTVVGVKAQIDDITVAGKTEKRKALYCQVDGNDQLLELSKRDQKPFPSVELTESYAGTGKVGLIALAFTDNPASIATERLQFSRVNGNLVFTSEGKVGLEFEAPSASLADQIASGLTRALGGLFSRKEDDRPKEEAKPKAANDNLDVAAFSTVLGGQIAAAMKPIVDAQAKMEADFSTLRGQLEKTEAPGGFSRQPSTGAQVDAAHLTDC